VKKQRLFFSEFIKEYFLDEVPVTLFVGDKKMSLVSYKVKFILFRKYSSKIGKSSLILASSALSG
jgi:hypothetical protein